MYFVFQLGISIRYQVLVLLLLGIRYWNLVFESLAKPCSGPLESGIGIIWYWNPWNLVLFPSLNKEFAEYWKAYPRRPKHESTEPDPSAPTYEQTVAAYSDILLCENIEAIGSCTISRPSSSSQGAKRPRMSLQEFITEVNPLPPCAPADSHIQKKARLQTPEPEAAEAESEMFSSPIESFDSEESVGSDESLLGLPNNWGHSSSTSGVRSKPYE